MRADVTPVLLCESARHAEWLRTRVDAVPKGARIIAANPAAAWALERRRLEFTLLEDHDRRRTVEEVEALLAGQIQWARWVDAFLQEQVAEFKQLDFRPARAYLFHIKSAWDTFIHRGALLDALALDCRPSEVLFFPNPGRVSFTEDMTIQGSALAESVPPWARHHGIATRPLRALRNDDVWKYQYNHIGLGFRAVLARWRQEVESSYQGLRRLTQPGASGAARGTVGRGPMVILKEGHDLVPEIAHALARRDVEVLRFETILPQLRSQRHADGAVRQALDRAWPLVVREGRFWQPGGFQRWSAESTVGPVFRHFWFVVVPALFTAVRSAVAIMRRRRPKAIAFGAVHGPRQIGLVMAARALGIPVVVYLHGVSVGDLEIPTIDIADRYWARVLLTYGAGQSTFLGCRPAYAEGHAVPISVGSARIDRLRIRAGTPRAARIRSRLSGSDRRPVVVYVPGVAFGNYYRFESVDFRDACTFEIRRRIAALFSRHPDVRFVYKSFLSQGHDPTLEMLAETCPTCEVVGNIPLTELQWAADALVHEIPSSGMVESLVTDKRVIVLANREVYRMSAHAKSLLQRRVALAETGSEFIDHVRSLLETARFDALQEPDELFLREFVTYQNDGASAARAVDAIYSLATEQMSMTNEPRGSLA